MPPIGLIKKDHPRKCMSCCVKEFIKPKCVLVEELMPRLPDITMSFEIEIDASNMTLDIVLLWDNQQVAIKSWKLSDVEKHYLTNEMEITVVICCLHLWRCYILEKLLNVWTNNVLLVTLRLRIVHNFLSLIYCLYNRLVLMVISL